MRENPRKIVTCGLFRNRTIADGFVRTYNKRLSRHPEGHWETTPLANRASTTHLAASGLAGREASRAEHGVRLIEAPEEGTSVEALPAGVYGFTYSPALAAPLFRTPSFRAFEMHRLSGETVILGFVTAGEAARLAQANEPADVTLLADAEGDADTLIAIPYSRITHHRQYSVRNEHGLRLQVRPAGDAMAV